MDMGWLKIELLFALVIWDGVWESGVVEACSLVMEAAVSRKEEVAKPAIWVSGWKFPKPGMAEVEKGDQEAMLLGKLSELGSGRKASDNKWW